MNDFHLNQVRELKQDLINLDPATTKNLIKRISSDERKFLVKVINDIEVSENNLCEILNKNIQEVKDLNPELTRKKDIKSNIAWFNKKIDKLISNVAYFFNILTAQKTYELVLKALNRSNISPTTDLPHISQLQLADLILREREKLPPGEKIDLGAILNSRGFSKEIVDMQFPDSFSLREMMLEGIIFKNCEFDWTPCSHSNLVNVTFQSCNIFNLSLMNSTLTNCSFDNCEMREVMFTGTQLNNVFFNKNSLISSSFEDATLTKCSFFNSTLPATHFLEATVNDSSMTQCRLENTVFFGTQGDFKMDDSSKKTAVIKKATTAILVHPENRGVSTPKAYMKLDQSANTIPLRISMQPQKATKENVNEEVTALLECIQSGNNDAGSPPLAQSLIQKIAEQPGSEGGKILKKASKLASQVDSFFLPGGEDVPPALYGKEEEEYTDWGGDYRRSILELGIIDQSFKKGIPLMGVCRGFQMSNVYFGARLIQDIHGHRGIQNFDLTNQRSLYAGAMKNSIVSAVFHHQAIPLEMQATEHLEPSVLYGKDIVKASEVAVGGASPMILLQFHPEFYKTASANNMWSEITDRNLNMIMSKENEAFWGILSDSAKAYRIKRAALALIREETLKYDPQKSRQWSALSNNTKPFNARVFRTNEIVLQRIKTIENRLN